MFQRLPAVGGMVGLLAACLMMVGAAADSSVSALDDWLVAEIIVDNTGTGIEVQWQVDLDLVPAGDDPRLLAFGGSQADQASHLWTHRLGPGSQSVAVVQPVVSLGNHELDVQSAPDGSVTASASFNYGSDAPRAHWLLTVMTSGVDFATAEFSLPVIVRGEAVQVTIHRGGGTRAMRTHDGAAYGAGADLQGLAGGLVMHEVDVAAGIHGALVEDDCDECSATWVDPNGRGDNWTYVDAVLFDDASGGTTFAGPPGTWQFTWAGASTGNSASLLTSSDAALAIWAPVGALYRHLDLLPNG